MKRVFCTKCKHFAGIVSKHYYRCKDCQMEGIYDIEFLTKGGCPSYVDIHDHDAMECSIKEDDQSLPDKE